MTPMRPFVVLLWQLVSNSKQGKIIPLFVAQVGAEPQYVQVSSPG